ncbi:MAG: hypothetical protein PF508_17640 [Spirochaeta sp.]|jgi:hypothetical protein|nr:hypothetical protein [Spirochaeta sp.]
MISRTDVEAITERTGELSSAATSIGEISAQLRTEADTLNRELQVFTV